MGVRRRVTLREASELLGVSREALRKRAKRGTLRSDKDPDGTVHVYLPIGGEAGRYAGGENKGSNTTLTDPRDELISTLREQLKAERNAHAETRRIAYTLAQRVPELEAAQEPPQAPETTSETTERVEGQADTAEVQGGVERRSWWRRWFGLE